ncbi:hypothetical protein SRHO_G00270400 [Serrasalmus rhombeus]
MSWGETESCRREPWRQGRDSGGNQDAIIPSSLPSQAHPGERGFPPELMLPQATAGNRKDGAALPGRMPSCKLSRLLGVTPRVNSKEGREGYSMSVLQGGRQING